MLAHLKLESIVGTVVARSFTGVEVQGVTDGIVNGQGKIILDGTAHSDFEF